MAYDLGTARGTIELEYEGRREVDKAERDMDRIEKKSKKTDKSVTALGGHLDTVFSGLKLAGVAAAFGTAAVQAANLAVQVLGIVPQLVSIGSLAAGLPAAFTGIIAIGGVLKATFAGVGDTLKAAFDPKGAAKFEEALKELSPEAQKFAKAVQKAVPFLKQYQQQIQETFFKASFLTGQVPRLTKALEGLRPAVLGLAEDFGEVTRKVANFTLSTDSLTFFNNALRATRASLSEASTAILPLLAGVRAVGSVGIPLLVRLGEVAGSVGTTFGQWLKEIANNGQLQEWINTAIQTLKTLGGIAQNVGSIIFSVIKAAGDVGGGLLNTIKEITGQFAAFLKSAEGSKAIRDLFAAIQQAAQQLSPVIVTLVGSLVKALAPALSTIAKTVGPALVQVVQKLAPVFGPLAAAIANLVTAIVPLLPPAAQLLALLARLASTVVTGLVAELGPLIQVLSAGLLRAFDKLEPVISELATTAMPILAESGVKLAEAFVPLIPALVEVAQAVAESLIPVLPDLTKAMISLVPVIIEMTNTFVELWNSGLNKVVLALPLLVRLFGLLLPAMNAPAVAAATLVTWVVKLFTALNNAGNAVKTFATNLAGTFLNALKQAAQLVTSIGAQIIGWFQALPSRLLSAVSALPGLLANVFRTAMNGLATLIGTAAGVLVAIFTKLPGRIMAALAQVPGLLFNLFNTALNRLKSLVSGAINTVVGFFSQAPRRSKSALSSLGSTLASVASSALTRFRNAISSGVTNAINFVKGIPGRVRSALGNTGSLLYNSGVNIMRGLYNGVVSQAGRVLDYIRGLADRVISAFNRALDIFSPSKVFIKSGVNIDEGLIEGLRRKIGEVSRTAVALANTVIAPTVALPTTATASVAALSPTPTATASTTPQQTNPDQFGPYYFTLDGKVLAGFVVDAISGNPTAVSKAADNGKRARSWQGSGRTVVVA